MVDILVKGAAWQHGQLILAKASEESPLELGPSYCSDPDCEYCKELRETEDKMAKGQCRKVPRGALTARREYDSYA